MSDTPRTLDGKPAEDNDPLPSGWGQPQRREGRIGESSGGNPGQRRSGGIATLFNTGLSGSSAPQRRPDDDDEDQEFFAGGEKSGLAVTNPDQSTPLGHRDMVKNILQQARQNGPTEAPSSQSPLFGGSGNRLGSEEEEATTRSEQSSAQAQAEDEPEAQQRHLTFWSNGFSIEDGPLMPYDDPQTKEILEAIQTGRAPPSLFNVRYDQPVQIVVAQRTQEEYQPPPKKPMQAFEGGGNRLGAVTPDIVPGAYSARGSTSSPAPASSTPTFAVDDSQPTTSIQVRFGDGTRMVAKVNLTHTIEDLRTFVRAARSDVRPFVLQTTFPSKELSDPTQTVEGAKLQNAVVVQRYT